MDISGIGHMFDMFWRVSQTLINSKMIFGMEAQSVRTIFFSTLKTER